MHQSQKHLILQHVLQTLWHHEWLLVFSATTIFSQAEQVPPGTDRATTSSVLGLHHPRARGHEQEHVGVGLSDYTNVIK